VAALVRAWLVKDLPFARVVYQSLDISMGRMARHRPVTAQVADV